MEAPLPEPCFVRYGMVSGRVWARFKSVYSGIATRMLAATPKVPSVTAFAR
jgi:hypothetical protein